MEKNPMKTSEPVDENASDAEANAQGCGAQEGVRVASRLRIVGRNFTTGSIYSFEVRVPGVASQHSHLGYVSPIEFELRSQLAAFAA
jgi:hypothetical protein